MSRLIDEIKKYQEGFKQKAPIEIQNIMLSATKKLQDQSISKNALKVGDTVKEFNLPNAVSKEISLSEVLKSNDFAIVSFYRGV